MFLLVVVGCMCMGVCLCGGCDECVVVVVDD